jgi:hypothetical protein
MFLLLTSTNPAKAGHRGPPKAVSGRYPILDAMYGLTVFVIKASFRPSSTRDFIGQSILSAGENKK